MQGKLLFLLVFSFLFFFFHSFQINGMIYSMALLPRGSLGPSLHLYKKGVLINLGSLMLIASFWFLYALYMCLFFYPPAVSTKISSLLLHSQCCFLLSSFLLFSYKNKRSLELKVYFSCQTFQLFLASHTKWRCRDNKIAHGINVDKVSRVEV